MSIIWLSGAPLQQKGFRLYLWPHVLCWRQTGILSKPCSEDISLAITTGQWIFMEKTINVIAYLGWISYVHYVLWHFSNWDSKWSDWLYHRDQSELGNANKYRPYQCEAHRHSLTLHLLLYRGTFNQKFYYIIINLVIFIVDSQIAGLGNHTTTTWTVMLYCEPEIRPDESRSWKKLMKDTRVQLTEQLLWATPFTLVRQHEPHFLCCNSRPCICY